MSSTFFGVDRRRWRRFFRLLLRNRVWTDVVGGPTGFGGNVLLGLTVVLSLRRLAKESRASAGVWSWAIAGSDPQTKVRQSNSAKIGRATSPFTPF